DPNLPSTRRPHQPSRVFGSLLPSSRTSSSRQTSWRFGSTPRHLCPHRHLCAHFRRGRRKSSVDESHRSCNTSDLPQPLLHILDRTFFPRCCHLHEPCEPQLELSRVRS